MQKPPLWRLFALYGVKGTNPLFDYDEISRWLIEEEHGRNEGSEHESCSHCNTKSLIIDGAFCVLWDAISLTKMSLPMKNRWEKNLIITPSRAVLPSK